MKIGSQDSRKEVNPSIGAKQTKGCCSSRSSYANGHIKRKI
jgi:hypothetical protein